MAAIWNEQNFEAEVLKSEVPVLVDFYADWCGPCKMMAPIVSELAEEYEGKVKIGKVNVDESRDLAGQYQIRNIPSFLIFKDGQAVEKYVGSMKKAELEEKLTAVL
ncbi:MAG: thioredoxin [Lachnospiraceae bacterium]|nr:thioredoxin [Lachnospiraceae bacterium]